MLDKSKLFRKIQLDILKEIVEHGKIQKHYRHSCCKRTNSVILTICCGSTCCLPYLMWDCCCESLNIICQNPCRRGLGFRFITKMCDHTFEDSRVETLKLIKRTDVMQDDLYYVCNEYITEFDNCLKVGKAKEANILRENIVMLLRNYTNDIKYLMLKDDGNVPFLRQCISEINM